MLRLESNCKSTSLTVDGRALTMSQFDIKEFPITPLLKDPHRSVVMASDLLLGIERVKDAMSDDESRYILNGICFEHTGTYYQLIGTNGRYLSQYTASILNRPVPDKLPPQVILPSKAVLHLIKLLKLAGDQNITILNDEKYFRFIAEEAGLMLSSRVIDGNFPNWRQVVPQEMKHTLKIDPDEWIAALKVARGSTSEDKNSVQLRFERGNVRITANDGQGNKAEVPIKHIEWKAKQPLTTAFNPSYLLTLLAPHKGATYEVEVGVTDELSPIRISCKQTMHNGLSVCMPVQIS